MIRCTPLSICSWNFLLSCEGHRVIVEFNWAGEQGVIRVDGERFDVRKHGMLSGHWTLEQGGREIISAQKSSPFTRSFDVQDPSNHLVLRANSPFGRSFSVERDGGAIAAISPVHPFTRRATIETLVKDWDITTMSFLFWLVVLTWRRTAQNDGAAASG